MGWGDLDDGPLLAAMNGRFEILVTVDKGLKRRRISGRSFAVIVLRARTNQLEDLLPLVPKLKETIEFAQPGEMHEVSAFADL